MLASVFKGKETIEADRNYPMPAIKDDEIMIQVKAAGICGTDVHIYYGMPGATKPTVPVVLGHEFSGIVTECGSAIVNFKPGDHVTVDPNIYCGNCDPCHTGKKQYCVHMSAIGVNQDGGFEEYCAVPEKQAILLESSVDFEEGAMGEPVACCLHGIDNIQIHPGDTVCVIGGGAIGQIMCQLARLAGASKVVLSEPVALRRDLAISLGADATIDPTSGDVGELIKEAVGADGCDVVIECVGKPFAVTQAVTMTARGGKVLIFSVPDPDAVLELSLHDVFQKELTIKGSFVNPDTQLRAAKLISSGRLNLKPLITHRYPVDKLDEAIKMQISSESVKVVIVP